jgi:carboxymethylenebutenolidase
MHSETIDVQTPDGIADSYLTRPSDDGPHPGVLLMIDAIGLRPRIEEMADRIARDGYVVLAPNAFYRAGRAPLWETPDFADADARARFMQSLGPIMGALTADRIVADGGAYLDRLAELADGPVGVTGYCMGGRLGWTIAASHPDRVAALGAFHSGRLVTGDDDSPHLLASSVTAEVYFGHADQDESMTPQDIATLDRAMDDAGVRHTTELYEGAAHGYTMSDMAVFNQAACERHFDALGALLGRTLTAS